MALSLKLGFKGIGEWDVPEGGPHFWPIPSASVKEVYDVMACGELLPLWWKGVYLDAEKLTKRIGRKSATACARGRAAFLPYELNFNVEAVELDPGRRVVVKTIGDFDGR